MRAHVGGPREPYEGGRYFLGFGPTLCRTLRPTSSATPTPAVQGRPARGFCDSAGIPHRRDCARTQRLRDVTSKRGSGWWGCSPACHELVIGLVLIYGMALMWGLPNLHPQPAPMSAEPIVSIRNSAGAWASARGQARPAAAGIRQATSRPGPRHRLHNPDEMVAAVRKLHRADGLSVERDGSRIHHHVDVTHRPTLTSYTAQAPSTVAAVGIPPR